jgi:hypothetical protein
VHEGLLDQSEAVILKHFQKIYQPFFTRLVLAGRSGVGTSRLSQLSSRDPKTRLTRPSRPAILFLSLARDIVCWPFLLFLLYETTSCNAALLRSAFVRHFNRKGR